MDIKNFSSLSSNDVQLAGGKGASLGEMTQAQFPIPSGYVILSTVFDDFVKERNLSKKIGDTLKTVNPSELSTVDQASQDIQNLILNEELPKSLEEDILKHFKELNCEFVAVRSSATAEDSAEAAWAGQLDTFLNTTSEDLLENVKKCWASLFTPRAISYRFEKELENQHISVAVVVQKMVQSEISGIAFSVHPVTQDYNSLIIEAGFGLGEAIVSGQVTPDSYTVDKSNLKITEKNISDQKKKLTKTNKGNTWIELNDGEIQKLSEEHIQELSKEIMKIETHYGFPCDIEWAVEENQIYITQSRPITTLDPVDKLTKKTYEKTIERDTTLIMEHPFGKAMKKDLKSVYDINIYNEDPAYFHLTNKKNIIFFENIQDRKKLVKIIQEKFEQDPLFINKVYEEYFSSIEEIREFWKKGKVSSPKELKKFAEIAQKPILSVAICFFAGDCESLPKKIKEKVISLRSIDNFFAQSDSLVRNTLESLGVNKEYLNIIAIEEVENLPSNEELNKRIKNGVGLIDGELFKLDEGQTIQDCFSDYNFKLKNNTKIKDNEIKGTIGYNGKVSGVVKKVFNKKDIDNVEEGEILVSPMTTPDFLPAMKKAAAFVTDEGGITCHAAIVAREMRKPCVIGTKIATEVVKDGDLVEVNADEGTVKILNKNSSNIFDLELLDSRRWIEQGRWIQSVFASSLFTAWAFSKPVKELAPELKAHSLFTIDGYSFFRIEDKKALKEFIRHKFEKNELTSFVEKLNIYGENIRLQLKEIISQSDTNFIKNIKGNIEFHKEAMHYWALTAFVAEWMHEVAQEIGFIKNESELFEKVHPYLKDTWIEKEVKLVVKAAKEIIKLSSSPNQEEILNLISNEKSIGAYWEEYRKEYSWIKMSKWLGEPIEKGHFVSRILEEVDNVMKNNHIKLDKKDPKRASPLIQLAASSAFWRAEGGSFEMMMSLRMKNILRIKTKELNLDSYEELLSFSPTEIIEIFEDKYQDNIKNKVIERENSFLTVYKESEFVILSQSSSEYQLIFEEFITKTNNKADADNLIGTAASKGKVRGKVRIILSSKEFDSFQEGEILVAPETTPTFVPLMRKSLAILTGKGGITSHAAIVSRELKKPCIIGVKRITEILETGDEVEVDAENGIIKRINTPPKQIKWVKKVSRDISLTSIWYAVLGHSKNMKELISINFDNVGYYFNGENVQGIKDSIQLGELKKVISEMSDEELLKLLNSFRKLIILKEKIVNKFISLNLSKTDKEKILEKYLEFHIFYQKFWGYHVIMFFIMDILNKLDRNDFLEKHNELFKTIRSINPYLDIDEKLLTHLYTFISGEEGIKVDLLFFLLPEEILHYLKKEELKITKKELQKRKRGFIVLSLQGHITIKTNGDAEEQFNELFKQENIREGETIKGESAFKGKVKGKAIIVKTKKDFDKISGGEILVAPMTTIDFTPLLKKVAGIITDEGGIGCHAAIISRELKIPCIIGTKIATEVLSDGDEVEVDAENGVIKKLNTTTKELVHIATHYYPLSLIQKAYEAQSKEFKSLIGFGLEDTITHFDGKKMQMFRIKEDIKQLEEAVTIYANSLSSSQKQKALSDYKKKIERITKENLKTKETFNQFRTLYAIGTIWYYHSTFNETSLASDEKKLCLAFRKALDKLTEYMENYLETISKESKVDVYLAPVEFFTEEKVIPSWIKEGFICSKGQVINKKWNQFLEEQGYEVEKIKTEEEGYIIKGTCAYKGNVKGTVKIVHNPNEFSKIEKGDILVTPMTTVTFTKILDKVSAIITDEGGTLCHAAIISRELKIPCIIGTKHATTTLKQGEKVEVDAENGIIRRL